MTFAIYPLVYLPVAASLRNADPGQEEVARSLGVGKVATFWKVTLGQARLAVLGGCVLVALVILSEYGAFELLGYRTFTTEIFTEAQVGFNAPAACGLSLVLVTLGLLVSVEGGSGAAAAPAGSGRWPPASPSPIGWDGPPWRCWRRSSSWWPRRWGCLSGPSSTGCSRRHNDAPGRGVGGLGRRPHRLLQRRGRTHGHGRRHPGGAPVGAPPGGG